jgi:hypothetical protein
MLMSKHGYGLRVGNWIARYIEGVIAARKAGRGELGT